ncbi:MAG: Asp-tRNA(Asn)/Glu-tRNA(Gln) amidotransferase subunit GatA [bacterium]
MKPNELTLKQASEALAAKKLTSVELTTACLNEIEARDAELGAFLSVDREGALKMAKESDARYAKVESLSPLDGIPLAIKDNILVRGQKATAGSKMLENYTATYDATVIERLKAAGAVLIGKTNCDEFAMGSSGENSAFQKTKNPYDTSRVPGGSSSGSAVAVSANMAFGSLGSDTGGSIRLPAAFTGVVGLKPTYGRVSRYGAIAMASSLDQIGPFGKSVWDVAAIMTAIEGYDEKDATSAKEISAVPPELLSANMKGKKIGVPKEYFIDGMDPLVERCVRESIDAMKEMGAEIVDISLPHAKYALETYYIVMPAEVSSNLSRYDGIRYGTRLDGGSLEESYKKTRGELFGAEPKRRSMIGSYVLSAGYYDAYYDKAQRVRTLLRRDFEEAFKLCDVIVSPVSPTVAFKVGEKMADPIAMYLSDIYTVSANMAGIPGLSLPCGFAHGMPVGLQLMGKWFDEASILNVGLAFESQRDWRVHSY